MSIRPIATSTVGLVGVAGFLAAAVLGGGYAPTVWMLGGVIGVLLLGSTLAAGVGRLRGMPRPLALGLAGFAAYVAWSYASVAWAASPGEALEGSHRALVYLVVFALFAVLPWEPRTAHRAMVVWVLGVAVIDVVALVKLGTTSHPARLLAEDRLVWPLGYRNAVAALSTSAALAAVVLAAARTTSTWLRPLLSGATGLGLTVALLTQSRGWLFTLPLVCLVGLALAPHRLRLVLWFVAPVAAVALLHGPLVALTAQAGVGSLRELAVSAAQAGLGVGVASLIAGLVLTILDRRVTISPRTGRQLGQATAAAAALAAAVAVAVALVAVHGRVGHQLDRAWRSFSDYTEAGGGRTHFADLSTGRSEIYRVALVLARAKPWVGLGQDNFGTEFARLRRSDEEPRWTHSWELRLLVHTGVVGVVLFLLGLVAALVAAVRARRRTPVLVAAALMPLTAWLLHGSVDWFWEIPALTAPALAFLGMAGSVGSSDAPPPPVARSRPRIAAGLATALVLAAALVALGSAWTSERLTATAGVDWRQDPSRALRELDRAARLDPLGASPDVLAGVIAARVDAPVLAARRMARARSRSPDAWFPVFLDGVIASQRGRPRLARRYFLEARARNPRERIISTALHRADTARPLGMVEALRVLGGRIRRRLGQTATTAGASPVPVRAGKA